MSSYISNGGEDIVTNHNFGDHPAEIFDLSLEASPVLSRSGSKIHIECAVSLAKYEKHNNKSLATTVNKRPPTLRDSNSSPLILPNFNHEQ